MADLVTIAVPALPAAGTVTGNELVPVHQNGRLVRIAQADLTAAGAVLRVAGATIPDWTVVVAINGRVYPADPRIATHCGLVLGIVIAGVPNGTRARVQFTGDLSSLPSSYASGARLYIADGTGGVHLGGLTLSAPSAVGYWSQRFATSGGNSTAIIDLGPAGVLSDGLALILADQTIAPARIARKAVPDATYAILPTDVYVALTSLSVGRTMTLPPAASFPPGQPLFIADETGDCSPARPITVAAAGSDKIGDSTGLVSFVSLGSPFQKLTFHSNGSNLWTYA